MNKLILFYTPIFLIALGFYRNSWFPGGTSLYGKEIWVIFFVSVLFLMYFLDFSVFFNMKVHLFEGYNKYLTLLFGLLLVSTLLYNSHEISKLKFLIRNLDYLLYFIIFFLIYPKFIVLTPFLFKKFVKFISILGFITSLFGIILLAINFVPDPKFAGTLISYIEQPNYVVFITNLGIISTLYYYDWQKDELSLMSRIFFILSFFIQLAATLLTLSRGGYIGIAMGLIVYFAFKYRTKIILILPIVFGLAAVIIPPFFKAKGFASFLSRIYLLVPAYYMFTRDNSSIIWGHGISNTFGEFLKYNAIYNINEFHLNNPHNAFVSLLLMFGLLFFLVLFTLVSLMLIRVSIRSIREKNHTMSLFYSFIVSVVVLLSFQSIFDSEIVVIEFFSLQFMLIFLGLLKLFSFSNNIGNPVNNIRTVSQIQ